MAAFEYWHEHDANDYRISIYISRDCDPEAIERGELKPGKLSSFQMGFVKFFKEEVVREFYEYNALTAGEWLRDEIGYGPAKDALTAMDVPKDALVWKLGEKG